LTVLPFIAIAVAFASTVRGARVQCKGGPYCYVKFATVVFIVSALMLLVTGHPWFGRVVDMTWYMPSQTYLQIFGFFAIVICGAAYELLPDVMASKLPFRGFVRAQHWLFMIGTAVLVVPLAIAGIRQGLELQTSMKFNEIVNGTLNYLRVSSVGYLFLLLGSLLFAMNIFAMTTAWLAQSAKSLAASFAASFDGEDSREVKS
ncbi:MAG: cbb3-type cytochrome c oxidase subunit I, partial [Limisphaerales bacterium]